MLTLYAIATLIGGILVGSSILLGDADVDVEADLDVDADADVDADTGGHDADVAGQDIGAWLPFLSLRC